MVQVDLSTIRLARQAIDGSGEAFGELFERWFERAFDVAWHVVRNRDTAAEVTQEAFATAWQQVGTLRQPESFGGWILRIARNKALNRLDRERRSSPQGSEEVLAVLDFDNRAADDPATRVSDDQRDDLVWAASAALGSDDASLLSLHLRHGLDARELADELGVTANAAHQRMFRLKKRLGDAIGAWALWHGGTPMCDGLRTLLAHAGCEDFDNVTSSMITAHERSCPDCRTQRELQLSPEALFAATPLVLAGPLVKAKVAAALIADGVPAGTSGSAAEAGADADADPEAQTGADAEVEPDVEAQADADAGTGGDGTQPAGRSRFARGPRSQALLVAAAIVAVVALAVAVSAARNGDDRRGTLIAGGSDEGTTTSSDDADGTTTKPPTTASTPNPTSAAQTGSSNPDGVVTPTSGSPDPGPTTTKPPGQQTTTSTTSTTEPQPAAPVIGGFRATKVPGSCVTGRVRVTMVWSSTGGVSALLGPSGGLAMPVAVSGTHTTCVAKGSTWTLQVSGPGGKDTAKVLMPTA